MIDNKILDKILLPLADQYESGRNDRCVTLTVTTPEEFEPFRETMAGLRAEGSVNMPIVGTYQMTASGYTKYADKIRALRVLAS
jgi:hypothetical protein